MSENVLLSVNMTSKLHTKVSADFRRSNVHFISLVKDNPVGTGLSRCSTGWWTRHCGSTCDLVSALHQQCVNSLAALRPSDKQTYHLEERASCGTQSLWDVSTVAQRPAATGLKRDGHFADMTAQSRRGQASAARRAAITPLSPFLMETRRIREVYCAEVVCLKWSDVRRRRETFLHEIDVIIYISV